MNTEKQTICKRGVWDTSLPGITFDQEGASTYYKIQKTLMEMYPRGETGLKNWEKIIYLVKKRGKKRQYDCIVGVSGGVDSSNLLFLLKSEGLRILAVNLDNGWSSNIAVKNIKTVTSALKIDLETYVINYEEIKDLLRAYMRAGMPWIDIPTDMAIKATMYNVALKLGIKYIFRGNDFRSEGKQPREWTYSDSKQLHYIHKKFGQIKKLKTYPDLPFWKIIYAGFIRGIKDIRPYYYLEYRKQDARKFLENEFNWEYYGGHHHENIFTRYAIAYWLPRKFGIDKRKITLSAQVISGQILREEALAELKKDPYQINEMEKDRIYIMKKLDLDEDEYQRIWSSPNKNYTDYPSHFKVLERLQWFSGPILKLIYPTKPMAFIEMSERKKK